ncbi:PUA-like domain-containing protein [Kalaharituber pfeilii]|nr:PUA-like domain-containing protein [Kalaharituber pfeilii]
MAPLTEYEIQRQKNIAANLAILASLGLEKPTTAVPKPRKLKANPKPKHSESIQFTVPKPIERKRSLEMPAEEIEDQERGRRKSARLNAAAARKSYRGQDGTAVISYDSPAYDSDLSDADAEGPRGVYNNGDKPGLPRRMVNGRYVAHIDPKFNRPNPKVFGPIPGIEVGHWWAMRQEASVAGVHAPFVAGIFGSEAEGAYSVALSGGYEDDIDEGFRFTFTGSGGRELKKKNLRTAPQSKDQQLVKGNAALVKSYETGKPIRVIRGFKGDPKWAPKSGYRYDGLYQVCKWWEDKGLSGYKVYKFAFKRIDGQPPIDLTGESHYTV